MKKRIIIILGIFLCIVICASTGSAEYEQSGIFLYSVENEEVYIHGFVGDETVLNIPAEISGYPVVSVALNDEPNLENRESVTKVILPKSVTVLGSNAFAGFRQLRKLEGLEYIHRVEQYAFCCIPMTDMIFSTELEFVGKGAFESSLMQHLTLPDDVDHEEGAFHSFYGLESIDFIPGKGEAKLKKCDDAIFSIDGKKLVAYPVGNGKVTYTVPDGTEKIEEGAFWNAGNRLLELTIPRSVVEMDEAINPTIKLMVYVYEGSTAEEVLYHMRDSYSSDWMEYQVIADDKEIVSLEKIAQEILDEIITDDMGVWEKSRAIYDWIILNCEYDLGYEKSSAADMLRYHTGVCAGYSAVFRYLALLANIECLEVGNYNHSFNAVHLEDDTWMYVDSTWGDGGDTVNYLYFGFEDTVRHLFYGSDVPDYYNSMSVRQPDLNDRSGRNHYYYRKGMLDAGLITLKDIINSELAENKSNFEISNEILQKIMNTAENAEGCLYAAILSEEEWALPGRMKLQCTYMPATGLIIAILDETDDVLQDYSYDLYNGMIRITKYQGDDVDIAIPDTICGYKVGCIGEKAFYANGEIHSVIFPDSVEEIGGNAFRDCVALESITIPSNLKRIDGQAFMNCRKLKTDLIFPEGFSTMEPDAFEFCVSIQNVVIPGTLSVIQDCVFMGCTGLEEVTLCEGVTTLGGSCFSGCSGITEIILPDTLAWISGNVFNGCSMHSIRLPRNLTGIGSAPFENCNELTELELDPGNPYLVLINGTIYSADLKIAYMSLDNRSAMTDEFSLVQGVETLRSRAFASIKGLKSLRIPDSVKTIENEAFYHCVDLEYLNMGNGLEYIGDAAFTGCKLHKIDFSPLLQYIGRDCFFNADFSEMPEIYLPESLEYIGTDAFMPVYSYGVYVPAKTELSNDSCFRFGGLFLDCEFSIACYAGSPAERHAILNGIPYQLIGEPVEAMWDYAAEKCIDDNVAKVEIVNAPWIAEIVYEDNTASEAGIYFAKAFLHYRVGDKPDLFWSELEWEAREHDVVTDEAIEATITTNGLTEGNHCGRCGKVLVAQLETPMLPGNVVTGIYYSEDGKTLLGCSADVTGKAFIPEGVTTIAERAFMWCEGVEGFEFPSTLMSVGGYSFAMKKLTLPRTLRVIGERAFYSSNFTDDIIYISAREIGDEAFAFSSNYRTVVIQNGLREIPSGCFANSSIKHVFIPESVTEVAINAFDGIYDYPLVIHGETGSYAEFFAEQLEERLGTENVRFEAVTNTVCEGAEILIDDSIAAGCATPGLTSGSRCSKCGEILIAQEEMPPTGVHMMKNGKCVTCGNDFDLAEMEVLRIPTSTVFIDAESFTSIMAEAVVIPNNCLVIDDKAFADCKNLKYVFLHEGVDIAPDAFEDDNVELIYW